MFSSHPLDHESNTFADDKGCRQLGAIPSAQPYSNHQPCDHQHHEGGWRRRAHKGSRQDWRTGLGSRDIQMMSLSG